MKNPLHKIVLSQKAGQALGIFSVCSANSLVIESAIRFAKQKNIIVLIEATANQVNQFGGYTNMTPKDFSNFVYEIADKVNFDRNKVLLGGDHLGPLVWSNENEDVAMQKAEKLIEDYIMAGFTKIHFDTTMKLNSDNQELVLSNEKIIARTIKLAKVAKQSFEKYQSSYMDAIEPVYVIGSEVPIPGGAFDDDEMHITETGDLIKMIYEFEEAFLKNELNSIWDNTIAIVVQPGVEFSNSHIHDYDPEKALDLKEVIKNLENYVYEGHSTDYQTKDNLRHLVEDGVAILKVGPGLTFALREALFLLELCEINLIKNEKDLSNFQSTLENIMIKDPQYWVKYYSSNQFEAQFERKYSFSDRCRYYFAYPEVDESINKLINNLSGNIISLPLLSNYLPKQYSKIRKGELKSHPKEIIFDYISQVLEDYLFATKQDELKLE